MGPIAICFCCIRLHNCWCDLNCEAVSRATVSELWSWVEPLLPARRAWQRGLCISVNFCVPGGAGCHHLAALVFMVQLGVAKMAKRTLSSHRKAELFDCWSLLLIPEWPTQKLPFFEPSKLKVTVFWPPPSHGSQTHKEMFVRILTNHRENSRSLSSHAQQWMHTLQKSEKLTGNNSSPQGNLSYPLGGYMWLP